ncbi:MAG: VOC family protein [Verrucomicrobiota bacterium JB022]|nr:VOC family protein [Verrucomicrobiota bacterium JB022]
MKFEHFALNVPDASAFTDWYVQHLGLQVLRRKDSPPYVAFLADSTGRCICEVYSNPAAPYPDYAAQHHLIFHFAFVAENAQAERDRVLQAGATLVVEDTTSDGSTVVTMRDPWGVPFQFCQRTKPF